MKKNYYMPLIDGEPGLWDEKDEEIYRANYGEAASAAKTRKTVQRWIDKSILKDGGYFLDYEYSIQRISVEVGGE